MFRNSKTDQFLDNFSKAGRFEYLYLLDIGRMAIQSNFSQLKRIDMEINFENIFIRNQNRRCAYAKKITGTDQPIYFNRSGP